MSNELALIEKQLNALAPKFDALLANSGVPAERLIRTLMVSIENTPKLLQCNRQSLIQAAHTAAVLGLEVDGFTGQAFLIPFKDRAQLVIGYKGFSTMAARSGYTINGGVVRDGDAFDYAEGTDGFVKHKRKLGGEAKRPIIAAWATATAPQRKAIVAILSIDELMATKDRSPGARKKDSPWNDPAIGFPAMCEKTAKRRLARNMPLNVMQYAAAMEDHLEMGHASHIDPEKGVVIDGDFTKEDARELSPEDLGPARFTIFKPDGSIWHEYEDVGQWTGQMLHSIDSLDGTPERLQLMIAANGTEIRRIATHHSEAQRVIDRLGVEGIEV